MNLIEELVALRDRHGHLREADLLELSRRSGIPLYEIEGVCSFYPHLRRTPPAPLRLRACRDLACHLRDGGQSLDELRRLCESRDDVDFEDVSCLGRCDSSPASTLNNVPLGNADARRVLDDPARLADFEVETTPRTWQIDPHDSPADRYGVLREWLESGRDEARRTALIDRLEASGLRGMGGAGFPTGRKWRLVAGAEGAPKVVICNADESEPGTFKDRVLLEELPHLVIEGMALAGFAVGSSEGILFIRHEYEHERVAFERALHDARRCGALGERIYGSDYCFDVRVAVSPGGYILGEETALLEALEGRRGEPRNKPPYPGTHGLQGRPTLINNVESLAQIPRVLRTGSAELKFFSVSGDVESPAVVEAPLGVSARELIERCGGMRGGRELLAFLPGGASTGFLTREHADLPLDWDSLSAVGSSLGSSAVLVVASGADLWNLAGNLTAFFRNESCGKCVPCRIGTEKAVEIITDPGPDAGQKLRELHETLRETSICGLGQAALNPVVSVLDHFPERCPREMDPDV